MGKRVSGYVYFQPNKKDLKDKYGDCVIRSMCKALDMEWLDVFDEMQPISREMQVPFNCRPCYEKYLEEVKGFNYTGISNKKGTKRPTVESFARSNRVGTYVLRLAHHIVTVVDGFYYDTWDCGDYSLYGYWEKVNK